jgi:RNA-directed DNA polymerase
VVSPLLSNLYLHEVLDVWFEHEVKPRLRGRAFEVRFADDAALVVFEREEDARRVLAVLSKRFAKYGLRLHPEKTRLVDFRSPLRAGRDSSQRERSFALLGFTHFWGRSRKGRWTVQRKTARDRFTRALRGIGHWCRVHRHWPVAAQRAALSRKLESHYAYYGITGNVRALGRFLRELERLWRKWLNRRSRHARMTWGKVQSPVATASAPQTACRSQCFPSRSDAIVRGAGCPNRARPDLWEPRVSNHPRRPGTCRYPAECD